MTDLGIKQDGSGPFGITRIIFFILKDGYSWWINVMPNDPDPSQTLFRVAGSNLPS